MKILDISVVLHDGMVTWPGLIRTRLTSHECIERGDPVNVTNLTCCTHAGSHVDAPFHHYKDGGTIDAVPLSRCMGNALVADLTTAPDGIDAGHIAAALEGQDGYDILLLKTRNSTEYRTWERFDERYAHITPGGAEEIIRRGIKTLGFDHLGVEGFQAKEGPAHKLLLGKADVTVIEGLDLRRIAAGPYWFCAAPIRLQGSDGAPVRAFLIQDPAGGFLDAWRNLERAPLASPNTGTPGA